MTSSHFAPDARDHAKCVKAGNDAAAFWMWAIQWSRKHRTQGFLDESNLFKIPPVPITVKRAKQLAEQCVAASIKPGGAGLFERAEGGYLVHDFESFYAADGDVSDAEWEKERLSEVRRAIGREGASKRWQKPIANDGKPDGNANGNQGVLPLATDSVCDASRARSNLSDQKSKDPEGNGNPDGTSNRARGGRGAVLAEDWEPTETDRAFAKKRGWNDQRIADEAVHFAAHHRSKGTTSKSWAASWVTWVMQGIRFERNSRASGLMPKQPRAAQGEYDWRAEADAKRNLGGGEG